MSKRSLPIPNSNPMQEKFINYIMQDGKKSVARKIFFDAFEEIRKRGNKDPEKIFEKALKNITPTLEVRPKRIGGAIYQIPLEVKPSRQVMLSLRWLREGSRNRKGAPMYKKLADELLDASNETGHAFKKKEDTTKMAQANKAFAHLARY
ncbi:30S ribosomal protein S7 [Patescibacteria group bacterium]|nr:30S ribosomal protein S7 [Patescibacteria group bacterium]